MSSNAMKRLQRLDFPDCTREALKHIVSTFASRDGPTIPGLNEGPESALGEIGQTYVLFKTKRGVKVLSALHELQLLELLCECFKAAPEKHQYHIFQLLFGARGDEHSNTLLTKLASMALSVACQPVLTCAAIWMQERHCHSPDSLMLTSRLVEDYCLLFPDPSNVFHKLPSISCLFVCNFTTAVTAFYTFDSQDSLPPVSLLEHVTAWVTSDYTMCCEAVRQAPIHGTCSSPIPGLLGWCVLGPVLVSHLLQAAPKKHKAKGGSKSGKVSGPSLTKTLAVLSKLHLGVLQSLDFCRASTLSQGLLGVSEAMAVVTRLSTLLEAVRGDKGAAGVKKEEEGEGVAHVAMERLAQVLQVAKMAGCLMTQTGSLADLAKLAQKQLPSNRLLNMVVNIPTERQSTRHTPMETS